MRRVLPLLLLAACQPVPHPFAGLSDRSVPPLKPPDAVGIRVAPVTGAPKEAGEDLAQSLRDDDVPASTEAGNKESFRLEAHALSPPTDGRETLDWVLRAPTGKALGRGTAEASVPSSGDVWAALAKDAAAAVARIVEGDAPTIAEQQDVAVALRDVKGAPGDGGTSIAHAIGPALQQAGVVVGTSGARFELSCAVAVAPQKNGQQLVTVRWILARPDGATIGEVSQQNEVPAGSLDHAWGDVAYDVADAAAPGIAQLIQRAQTVSE